MNSLKSIRVTKGISQEGLASVSGVSLRTIQRIEGGEALPRPQTLQTLAKTLEVEVKLLNTFQNEAMPEGKALLQKLALINGIAYLIFPLVAALISWINSNHLYSNYETRIHTRRLIQNCITRIHSFRLILYSYESC